MEGPATSPRPFSLPEEDEMTVCGRPNGNPPERGDGGGGKRRSWTVPELQAWAARLGARERAIATRETELEAREQRLEARLARMSKLSVERYRFLEQLDDRTVRRMQHYVRRWQRRRQWIKNLIRMRNCDDDALVRMRRRAATLKEIVQSEQSYIRSLQVLLMEFLLPIVEGGMLKDEEHMGISLTIGQVLSANKQFSMALQKRYAEWPRNNAFAAIFIEHVPTMKKAYTNYIAVFDHLTTVLMDYSTRRKSALALFLEEKSIKGGLDLKAYLIMPVQRLPRYEILLKELIKNTFPEHSDYESLQRALTKVKKMNSYVDMKKQEIDIKKEFLQIHQRQEKKVDHYLKQGKGMTLTTFSDLKELLTNKKDGTPDRTRRDKALAQDKDIPFAKKSMLKVCILEGRRISPVADGEAPNPYCVVTLGKQSYKSKKKTKTTSGFHPSWSNANFVFEVNDLRETVEIECWDASKLKADMIGRAKFTITDVIGTIPLPSEENDSGIIRSIEGKPRWYPLTEPDSEWEDIADAEAGKRGEIKVICHYMRADEEVERLRLLADAQRKRECSSETLVTQMSGSQQQPRISDGRCDEEPESDDAQREEREGRSAGEDSADLEKHKTKREKRERRKSSTFKEMLGEIKKEKRVAKDRLSEIKKKGHGTLHRRSRSEGKVPHAAIEHSDKEKEREGSGKKKRTGKPDSPSVSPFSGFNSSELELRSIMSSDSEVRGSSRAAQGEEEPEEWEIGAEFEPFKSSSTRTVGSAGEQTNGRVQEKKDGNKRQREKDAQDNTSESARREKKDDTTNDRKKMPEGSGVVNVKESIGTPPRSAPRNYAGDEPPPPPASSVPSALPLPVPMSNVLSLASAPSTPLSSSPAGKTSLVTISPRTSRLRGKGKGSRTGSRGRSDGIAQGEIAGVERRISEAPPPPGSPRSPRFLTPEELAEVIREKRAAAAAAASSGGMAASPKEETSEEEEYCRSDKATDEKSDSEDERSLQRARAKARRLHKRLQGGNSSSSDEDDEASE